jgi:tetraacyldisaccharide 4'-kinase
VHILDDGFQHLKLARGTDLLLISEADLDDRPLPAGRLRESLAAAASADAALVVAESDAAAQKVGRACRVSSVFRVTRHLGAPYGIATPDGSWSLPAGSRVFAVAAIARPERFFADVAALGWETAGTMTFRDHHPFTPQDLERIIAAAQAASAGAVLTTEKDAVRLEAFAGQVLRPALHAQPAIPFAALPLRVQVEPADAFRTWLMGRLR